LAFKAHSAQGRELGVARIGAQAIDLIELEWEFAAKTLLRAAVGEVFSIKHALWAIAATAACPRL
jgi:hypothetical protein